MIPIYAYRGELPQRLLSRSQLNMADVSASVKEILQNISARGDQALIEYTQKFDKVLLSPETLRVSEEEIQKAYRVVDGQLLNVLRRAIHSIRSYHEKQLQKTWVDFQPGGALGQLVRPLSSVGVYVPGGTAAYPSSVLMNVLPAKVAGVDRIVMVTPPGGEEGILPLTLVAAKEAGVTEIYRVGGAQAVGALAYGTATIAPVDKIVGPGNIYVANAKREVYGRVGIDMIAGPSEIVVVADKSANPAYVAADLLSQAEHDPLSACVLITDSQSLAEEAAKEAERQLALLPRRAIAEESLGRYGSILVTQSLEEAMQAANQFAPEHLELCVQSPYSLLGLVKNAGAVFLGHYAPEPYGDYIAGPNHVLPTSGTARFSSPLSVDDFIKKSSIIDCSREQFLSVAQDVVEFAQAEGLYAHANAAAIRIKEE